MKLGAQHAVRVPWVQKILRECWRAYVRWSPVERLIGRRLYSPYRGMSAVEPTTAAMLVLDPIFDADLPSEQYAYRQGRNAQQAVIEEEETLFREHPEVVDADLADNFGSIPHTELMRSLARRIMDGRVLHLIKMWLECAVEDTDDKGRKTRTTASFWPIPLSLFICLRACGRWRSSLLGAQPVPQVLRNQSRITIGTIELEEVARNALFQLLLRIIRTSAMTKEME